MFPDNNSSNRTVSQEHEQEQDSNSKQEYQKYILESLVLTS
jgi:hypothetical protein